LHSVGIAHRDLKPENVLCLDWRPEVRGHLKIADFGMAASFEPRSGGRFTEIMGTPEYMAPEVVRLFLCRRDASRRAAAAASALPRCSASSPRAEGAPHLTPSPTDVVSFGTYSEAADLWSLGCMCYELLAGDVPFVSDDDDTLWQMMCHAPLEFPRARFDGTSSEAIAALCGMLERDPARRLAADALCTSAWLCSVHMLEAQPSPRPEDRPHEEQAARKEAGAGQLRARRRAKQRLRIAALGVLACVRLEHEAYEQAHKQVHEARHSIEQLSEIHTASELPLVPVTRPTTNRNLSTDDVLMNGLTGDTPRELATSPPMLRGEKGDTKP